MCKTSKRIQSVQYVSRFETIFKCPICNSSLKVFREKSLICINNHTFDFAKQGYINLTTHPMKNSYSKELFDARRKLITEGTFFTPLHQAVAEAIDGYVDMNKETSIVDMGCGEGSTLTNICSMVSSRDRKTVTGVGVDISKEGIMAAARNHPGMIWTVADLTRAPFRDRQFDVILNILSPSNYGEFNRMLKAGGVVVKVVPQSDYLRELREGIFDEPEKQTYSNAETVELFRERFQLLDHTNLRYTMDLDYPFMESLVRMTPLTWTATEKQIESFLEDGSSQITVDLDILIGS